MKSLIAVLGMCLMSGVHAAGKLTDNIRIESAALGYALQYRVYTPERMPRRARLPVLYVTDGPGYISNGELPQLLDAEIARGTIDPVIAVFVDARNPDNTSVFSLMNSCRRSTRHIAQRQTGRAG